MEDSGNHPFHLRKDIDKHLDSLLEQDIIEKVKGIPTTWLSETVNVKKEGSKDIRMCIDMKAANTAIQSEKYEMPNIENLIYKATGMKVFNKIDLMSAFQQIELDTESIYISCFRTHRGIFQYNRLFFGIKSAPEIFHHKIQEVLEGIENTINATDDILIMGKDEKDSERNVDLVLSRFKTNGLTVNPACSTRKK